MDVIRKHSCFMVVKWVPKRAVGFGNWDPCSRNSCMCRRLSRHVMHFCYGGWDQ